MSVWGNMESRMTLSHPPGLPGIKEKNLVECPMQTENVEQPDIGRVVSTIAKSSTDATLGRSKWHDPIRVSEVRRMSESTVVPMTNPMWWEDAPMPLINNPLSPVSATSSTQCTKPDNSEMGGERRGYRNHVNWQPAQLGGNGKSLEISRLSKRGEEQKDSRTSHFRRRRVSTDVSCL